MISNITTSNINDFLNENNNVILKFGANWCNPCKVVEPILKDISHDTEGDDLAIGDIDIDYENNYELAEKFNIRNIPTTLIIKQGKILETINGSYTKVSLMKNINKTLHL